MPLYSALVIAMTLSLATPAASAEGYDQDDVAAADTDARDSGGAGREKKPNCERIRNFNQCVNTPGCRPSTNESNQVTPWTCLEE